jgi:hypothetical protein
MCAILESDSTGDYPTLGSLLGHNGRVIPLTDGGDDNGWLEHAMAETVRAAGTHPYAADKLIAALGQPPRRH